MSTTLILASLLSFFISRVTPFASTDTITWGGDNSRTGYQTNHNMDPSIVGSSQFGQLFVTVLPGNYGGVAEQVFSQPLVYTTADGVQYVYLATTQNNLYKINAKTGVIVMSRNLHLPFLTADLSGCVDINPHVGVTATGVIDPDTDTLYLTSKTYVDQSQINTAQGRPAGRYYLHAINVNDLTERANFPVDLEGTVARNNPIRSFNGGIHHQRPALLHTGQYIYAGFASHCVQWNFTGWIMGWDKMTGANVERWATEGQGVPNTTPGGGIWMSGGGIASDDAGSIFFGTGNGYASQLSTIPVNGRSPPASMEEAAVHMTINDDGSLTVVDFFIPWEKTQLDGADRDLGCSPLELLPSEFSCGDYRRIGVITGKSGKTYFLNLDDLGGYQNGPNKLDDIIEVYQNENSVYSGAGVYPLEGGYIYINVIQYPTHVFKFSCNAGIPSFTKVADSPTKNAYVLGTGHGTTTSLNGQPGTGLLWTSDVDGQNLRVYNAVPVNGLLTQIAGFNIPGVTKFTRPVFGDGRVYIGTTKGLFYGFGSPVNLPLNCTSPVDFGTSNVNTPTAPATITCLANIGVTVSNLNLTGNTNFNVTGIPTTPLTVAPGNSFSFQAYFNPQSVGPLSSDIVLTTANKVAGYSFNTPVTLRGTGQSVSPLLSVSPVTLAFQGVVTGAQVGGVNQSVLINNLGNAPLTVQNIQYSITSETGPFIAANQTSSGSQVGVFTFIGLPTTIPGNSGVTVIVNFDTSSSGNFAAYLKVVSNGGTKVFDVVGTSGSAPVAVLEFQTPDGSGWVTYQPGVNFTFGNVTENTTRNLKMRVTNNATTDGARLSLTVSKPPFGVAGIIGAANNIDLAEGTTLGAGESATASLYCSVPKVQWNTDQYSGTAQWTMNVDDPNFGKQYIQFACNAVSEQAAPLQISGQGLYRYTGCFKENNPGRQLKQQLYSDPNSTIAECVAACAAGNWIFCGAQYNKECWGGNSIPVQEVDESNCNYPCAGNINQICGGNGVGAGAGMSYMSLFADSSRFNGNVSSIIPTGPSINPGVNGFNSIGCYTEGTNARALPVGMNTADTVAACVNACGSSNYLYAGLEYGGQCWCGNALSAGSVQAPLSDCSMICNDNSTEYCGAGNRLNVYRKNGTYLASSTSMVSSASSTSTASGAIATGTSNSGPQIKYVVSARWIFQGCYTEGTNVRALGNITYTSNAMTLESCAAFCTGNSMFAVEYGRECYCANKLGTGSVLATTQTDCSFPCPGDGTEYCGAGNRLQLYSYSLLTSNSTSSSTIITSTSSIVLSSAPSFTPSSLTSNFSSSATSSSVPSSARSSTAPSLISNVSPSMLSSASSLGTMTSASTTVTRAGPTIVPSAGAYTYLGCYTEATSGRALSSQLYTNDSNTIAWCAQQCSSYTYFGAEYGRECWCGNSFGTGSTLISDSGCSMTCSGDKTAYCGAGNRLSVYVRNGTAAVSSWSGISVVSSSSSPQAPTSSSSFVSTNSQVLTSSPNSNGFTTTPASSPSISPTSSSTAPTQTGAIIKQTIGAYIYKGCYTEATNMRALSSSVSYNYTSMTLEMCATSCSGSTLWGVEYGGECYCGSSINAGSIIAPDTDCSFICPGSSFEYCGAGNRLSLYTLSSLGVGYSSGLSSSSPTMSSSMGQSSSGQFQSPTISQGSYSSSQSSTPSQSDSSSSAFSADPTTTTAKSPVISLSSSSSAKSTPTGPVVSTGNVNFTYYSCASEPSSGRLLSTQVENNGTYMTIEKCLANCWNYAFAGVEYGRECWCGNTLNIQAGTGASRNVSDSECSFTCPGNGTEFCGAGNRLSLYWFDGMAAGGSNGTGES